MTKCGLGPSALAPKVNSSLAQVEIEERRDEFMKTIQDSLIKTENQTARFGRTRRRQADLDQ